MPRARPLTPPRQPPPSNPSGNAGAWFLLGHEPLLSAAELAAVLHIAESDFWFEAPFLFVAKNNEDAELLIKRLGGTVKIAETAWWGVSKEKLLNSLTEDLQKKPGKIIFGLSLYGAGDTGEQLRAVRELGFGIKKMLEKNNRSARLIFKDTPALSSVTVAAQKLLTRGAEYLIYHTPEKFSAARTVAIQPFATWSERDYGRPRRDELSGMLPPKLARMLINLAGVPLEAALLDPFCGSGTIITEALTIGYRNLTGCDLSDQAIVDTKKNINWFQKNLQLTTYNLQPSLFQADVRDLAKKISAHSVDAIVTEPYLGPPLKGAEQPSEIQKNCAELAQLYAAAFQNFSHVLTPSGVVVMVIPQFILHNNKTYRVAETVLPKIKKLGFAPQPLLPKNIHPEPYLLYHRPGQRVGREIWKFRRTI